MRALVLKTLSGDFFSSHYGNSRITSRLMGGKIGENNISFGKWTIFWGVKI